MDYHNNWGKAERREGVDYRRSREIGHRNRKVAVLRGSGIGYAEEEENTGEDTRCWALYTYTVML